MNSPHGLNRYWLENMWSVCWSHFEATVGLKWNWMRFLHLRISQKVSRYPKNIKVASINYTYSPIAIQINGCVSTQRNYQTNSGPEKQKNKQIINNSNRAQSWRRIKYFNFCIISLKVDINFKVICTHSIVHVTTTSMKLQGKDVMFTFVHEDEKQIYNSTYRPRSPSGGSVSQFL